MKYVCIVVFLIAGMLFFSNANAAVIQTQKSVSGSFTGSNPPTISVNGNCPPINVKLEVSGVCEGISSKNTACGPAPVISGTYGKFLQHYANVSAEGTCFGNCTVWLNNTVSNICLNTNETFSEEYIKANCSGLLTTEIATILGGYNSSCNTGACNNFNCNIKTYYAPCTKYPQAIVNGSTWRYAGGLLNDTSNALIGIGINSNPASTGKKTVPGNLQLGSNLLDLSAVNLNKFNYTINWTEETVTTGGDTDGDGYYMNLCTLGNDCDDNDPNVYPGHSEIPNNRKDDNCNGVGDTLIIDSVDNITKNCQYIYNTKTYFCTRQVFMNPSGNAHVEDTDAQTKNAYHATSGNILMEGDSAQIINITFSTMFDSTEAGVVWSFLRDDSNAVGSIKVSKLDASNLKMEIYNTTQWYPVAYNIQPNKWYTFTIILDENKKIISVEVTGAGYLPVSATYALQSSYTIKWISILETPAVCVSWWGAGYCRSWYTAPLNLWLDNLRVIKKSISNALISEDSDDFESYSTGDSVLYQKEYGWENIILNNDITVPVSCSYTDGNRCDMWTVAECSPRNIIFEAKNDVSMKNFYTANGNGAGGFINIDAKKITAISLNSYGGMCQSSSCSCNGPYCGNSNGGDIMLKADIINVPTINANHGGGNAGHGGTITIIANKTFIDDIYSNGGRYNGCTWGDGHSDGSGSGGSVILKSKQANISSISLNGGYSSDCRPAGYGGYTKLAVDNLTLKSISSNGGYPGGSGGNTRIYSNNHTVNSITENGANGHTGSNCIISGGSGGLVGIFTDSNSTKPSITANGGSYKICTGYCGYANAPNGVLITAKKTVSGFFILEANLTSTAGYKSYLLKIKDEQTGEFVKDYGGYDYIQYGRITNKYITSAIGLTTKLMLKFGKDYDLVITASNESVFKIDNCGTSALCKNITIPFTKY